MTSWRVLRLALDRLTLYLPLLVMALLAMGSWWVVRSMPSVWSDEAPKPVRKDPDYHLENFTTQVFDAQGHRIREVHGEKGQHYPDVDELHIDGVRFFAVNEEGVEVRGTARQGIATGDGERVTLIGQAHVLRPAHKDVPRTEFFGERFVVAGRSFLSAGMIVRQDDPGCRTVHAFLKQDLGIHKSSGCSSYRQTINRQYFVGAIEVDRIKFLVLEVEKIRLQ